MDKTLAKSIIQDLTKKLNEYSRQYYNDGESEISDNEFDIMLTQLTELEQTYPDLQLKESPTLRVGVRTDGEFKKVTHKNPMLSLDNIYEPKELDHWLKSLKNRLAKSQDYKIDLKRRLIFSTQDNTTIGLIWKWQGYYKTEFFNCQAKCNRFGFYIGV
jgi:DNA ligase (NAD+)